MGISRVSNGNRSRFEIIADILKELHTPVGRTSLMCHCNMSSAQLDGYLNLLKSADLIRTDKAKRGPTFQITEMGKEFLRLFNKIVLLLEGWRKIDNQNGTKNAALERNLVVTEKTCGKHYPAVLFPFEKLNGETGTGVSGFEIEQAKAEALAVEWMNKNPKRDE